MRSSAIRRARASLRLRRASRWTAEALESRLLLSTYTVTSPADSGPGTLRDAITNSSADIISFGITGTITLASQLEVTRSIAITGPGAGSLTISGQNATRLFQIDLSESPVITGVTIANGHSASFAGAIFNQGNLTLTKCAITNNSAGTLAGAIATSGSLTLNSTSFASNTAGTNGGAIVNAGTLLVTGGAFSGNHAVTGGAIENHAGFDASFANVNFSQNVAADGGAIHNDGSVVVTGGALTGNTATMGDGGAVDNTGTLNITGASFTNNHAVRGGAVHNTSDATIEGGTLATNSAVGGLGAGIDNAGALTLTDSTVSGNTSDQSGGGIENEAGGQLTINFSTLSGNSASAGAGIDNAGAVTLDDSTLVRNACPASGQGGGILSSAGSALLSSCTVSQNTAGGSGGGISIGSGSVTLYNTIVAGNLNLSGVANDLSGALDAEPATGQAPSSYNLFGTGGAGGLVNGTNGNIVGVDNPVLAARELRRADSNHAAPARQPRHRPRIKRAGAGFQCLATGCTAQRSARAAPDQRWDSGYWRG